MRQTSNILQGGTRFSLSDSRQRELDHSDAQPLKITCGLCGKIFEGVAGKVRAEAFQHREKKHPETFLKKHTRSRKMRSLSSFRYASMDEQDIKEIEEDRRKRAFLIGIDLDAKT